MLRTLLRMGFRKGLIGGSKPWLVLGAAAGGIRLLGRMARREPEVVYCEELQPGQRVIVTHLTETKR